MSILKIIALIGTIICAVVILVSVLGLIYTVNLLCDDPFAAAENQTSAYLLTDHIFRYVSLPMEFRMVMDEETRKEDGYFVIVRDRIELPHNLYAEFINRSIAQDSTNPGNYRLIKEDQSARLNGLIKKIDPVNNYYWKSDIILFGHRGSDQNSDRVVYIDLDEYKKNLPLLIEESLKNTVFAKFFDPFYLSATKKLFGFKMGTTTCFHLVVKEGEEVVYQKGIEPESNQSSLFYERKLPFLTGTMKIYGHIQGHSEKMISESLKLPRNAVIVSLVLILVFIVVIIKLR